MPDHWTLKQLHNRIIFIHIVCNIRNIVALRRLRATNQIEEDIEEMRAEERAQQSEATISMMELVCSPTLRQPLIISVVMQLSQQLSGINAVSIIGNIQLINSINNIKETI